jgi:polar amino acid transport system substrate-binding protein
VHADALKLRAATLEYPPYQFIVDGKATGFSIDIINEISARLVDTHIEFNFYPWKRAVFSAQSGRSDLLFNAGKNKARQEWGKYTQSVLIEQEYVLFKRRDSNIEIMPDFSGASSYSIAVRAGYLYGSGKFRDALDNNSFLGIEYSESTAQSINMLLGQRVDVFVGDYLPVMHYIKANNLIEKIEIINDPTQVATYLTVLEWPTYLLFNRQNISDSLVSRFDDTLMEMKRDGTYQKLYLKYRDSLHR